MNEETQINEEVVQNQEQSTEKKADSAGLKTYRTIRQLVSSVACLVLAFFFMRYVLKGTANDNLVFQILIYIMSAGMFYCAFGISHWIIQGIIRKEIVKKNKAVNFLVETIIYLALGVGALFLIGFICNKVIWLGILFGIAGAFEVGYDICYLSQIEIK